ncbi:MAG TPA: ABC transporter substrate-binding protein [Candidatus Eisenbacteria bacterium]|nr:ABC transporter substrate-binding protein [Candidatus Eisenbacteria bacterium]
MKRSYVYGVAFLISTLLLVTGRSEAASKYTMAYVSDSPSSSVPFWVAKEAGLFKKHGLDIDLLFINGSTRAIQSLIAGDLNFSGAVGTSAMNGAMAGGEITIINGLVNTLPYYLIGKPTIKSPEDLRGKSAAVHVPGTSADFALRLALKRFGIPYEDIKAVMVGGSPARIAAVTSGQVDFTVVTEPGKIKGEKAGLKVILDMAKLDIPFQFTCTTTTRKMIRENPKDVMALVKAMAEAVHYYKNNKEHVIKIMQKYTRGQNRSVLEGAYAAYDELFVEDTYPTIEGLKNTLEIQASWDPKAAKAKVEDFVELKFVDELRKSGFIAKLYGERQVGSR